MRQQVAHPVHHTDGQIRVANRDVEGCGVDLKTPGQDGDIPNQFAVPGEDPRMGLGPAVRVGAGDRHPAAHLVEDVGHFRPLPGQCLPQAFHVGVEVHVQQGGDARQFRLQDPLRLLLVDHDRIPVRKLVDVPLQLPRFRVDNRVLFGNGELQGGFD